MISRTHSLVGRGFTLLNEGTFTIHGVGTTEHIEYGEHIYHYYKGKMLRNTHSRFTKLVDEDKGGDKCENVDRKHDLVDHWIYWKEDAERVAKVTAVDNVKGEYHYRVGGVDYTVNFGRVEFAD